MNIYDSPTDLGQKEGRTSVDNNGVCVTWPNKLFTVGCKLSIRKFPFDIQFCELDFLSWKNPSSVFKLKTSENITRHYYKESSELALDSYWVKHYLNPYGGDFWDHTAFKFTLRRKWLLYVINMIVPIMCISFLNIKCFTIP